MLPCDIKGGDPIAAIVHGMGSAAPRKKLANATIIMLYNYFGQYMNPLIMTPPYCGKLQTTW